MREYQYKWKDGELIEEEVVPDPEKIYNSIIDSYRVIENKDVITENFNSSFIELDRGYYLNNTKDKEFIRVHLKIAIHEVFFKARTRRYLVRKENIFKAIDRLKINKKDYVIVNFFNDDSDNIQLVLWYKGVEVYNYAINLPCYIDMLCHGYFIIKKTDLPSFVGNEIRWKNDAKVIMIVEHCQWNNRGIPHEISEIKKMR